MGHAENVRIFASGVPALERELERIYFVAVLVIAIGTSPVVAAGHLRVEHSACFPY
jgi:hypothetical protein